MTTNPKAMWWTVKITKPDGGLEFTRPVMYKKTYLEMVDDWQAAAPDHGYDIVPVIALDPDNDYQPFVQPNDD